MDAMELLYDYFEDRHHATETIRERKPYALGLLGALIGGISLFVAEEFAGSLSVLPFSVPSLIMILLWQMFLLFSSTAVLHLFLELSGAKGQAGALFVHLGLSELSWLAAIPALFIVQSLFPSSIWPVALVFVSVWFWSLALKARALRDEYGIGEGQAWLTLGSPILAFACFAGLSLTLAVITLLLKAFSS